MGKLYYWAFFREGRNSGRRETDARYRGRGRLPREGKGGEDPNS